MFESLVVCVQVSIMLVVTSLCALTRFSLLLLKFVSYDSSSYSIHSVSNTLADMYMCA